LIWFVFKCLVLMLLSLTLVKSATGRFRIDQAFRFYVKVPTVLALVSLVLVWAL
ncbi:NADH-quinone oxidoreductase subunit H, partial [Desulfovibrio sp.]